MEEIRLFCGGQPRGTVTLEQGDSRREVRAAMADPRDGLYRAFLVGERGELPLGVMEPDHGALTVCRRIYARDIAALGTLHRGEARLSFRFGESAWQEVREDPPRFPPPGGRAAVAGLSCGGGKALSSGDAVLFGPSPPGGGPAVRGVCL